MSAPSRRSFTIEYESGVSAAERTLERKTVASLGGDFPTGGQDGQNVRYNLVTTERYQDSRSGSESLSLGLSATWACVNLLAGTIASLPVSVYRRGPAGVAVEATDHPLYWLLHDSPNYDQSAYDFWEYMCAAIELRGNAYAVMDRRADGFLVSLTPLKPDMVTARRLSSGDIEYSWADDGVTGDIRTA